MTKTERKKQNFRKWYNQLKNGEIYTTKDLRKVFEEDGAQLYVWMRMTGFKETVDKDRIQNGVYKKKTREQELNVAEDGTAKNGKSMYLTDVEGLIKSTRAKLKEVMTALEVLENEMTYLRNEEK